MCAQESFIKNVDILIVHIPKSGVVADLLIKTFWTVFYLTERYYILSPELSTADVAA
jgi:hypothetical protein